MIDAVVRQMKNVTDPVLPTLIEHRVDAATDPESGRFAYFYNYIHYEFDVSAGRISALSYLHDIGRAIVTAPMGTVIGAADVANVLAYLQLRFEVVVVRDEAGNELLVWPRGAETEAGC
jgi:hypothetical protein